MVRLQPAGTLRRRNIARASRLPATPAAPRPSRHRQEELSCTRFAPLVCCIRQQAQFSTNRSPDIAYCFHSEARCPIEVIVSSIRCLVPPQGAVAPPRPIGQIIPIAPAAQLDTTLTSVSGLTVTI